MNIIWCKEILILLAGDSYITGIVFGVLWIQLPKEKKYPQRLKLHFPYDYKKLDLYLQL